MALRIPIPASLRSTTTRSEIRPARGTTLRASLKQHPQQKKIFSPLFTTEEIASDIGREITVLELERLFKETSDCFLPKLFGPSNPLPAAGFSGRPVRIAYQGVRGSYCQEAATKAFSTVCNAFPCNQMEEAFQALEEKTADRAIIPVENSIDGTIDRNFDLLLRHESVQIVGELILPVNHCLLAVPGASRSNVKRIVSHPQALSHCKTKLEMLNLETDEVPNAADAARYISESHISDTAVIGSKIAAREFGLQILEQNFQDKATESFNRFLQLGLEPPANPKKESSRGWKTTVAFSLDNGVSDLYRALWLFESRNVSVTRVEQRPNRSNPIRTVEKKSGEFKYLDYVFILDLEGSVSDSSINIGLSRLREISGFVRVLGSYPWKLKN